MILHPNHAELRRLRCSYGLTMQPVKRTVFRKLQQRPVQQTTVRGHQEPVDGFIASVGMYLLQLFQGDCLRQAERTCLGTTQFCDVSTATQRSEERRVGKE